MKTIILVAAAVFFTVDSILRSIRANHNLGSFMMWCIAAAFWVYALFHRQIDTFCSHGVGLIFKWVFWAGCLFVAGMIAFIALKSYSQPASGNEKSIIVLGAGLRGTKVSGLLARRLDAAYDYYVENPDITVVVTGGQGPQEEIPEAEAMYLYLVKKGVPPQQIIREDKSVSTQENFAFAKELLAQRGIAADEPMVFVTNNFHCYRAEQYALKVGFTTVNAIPASIGASSVLPCYLREVLAVLYYWVFQQWKF